MCRRGPRWPKLCYVEQLRSLEGKGGWICATWNNFENWRIGLCAAISELDLCHVEQFGWRGQIVLRGTICLLGWVEAGAWNCATWNNSDRGSRNLAKLAPKLFHVAQFPSLGIRVGLKYGRLSWRFGGDGVSLCRIVLRSTIWPECFRFELFYVAQFGPAGGGGYKPSPCLTERELTGLP